MPLDYDPDFKTAIAPFAGVVPPVPSDALEIRTNANNGYAFLCGNIKVPVPVEEAVFRVPTNDGASIPVHRFTPPGVDASSPQPAILYCHGGGTVAGSVLLEKSIIANIAAAASKIVYAVEYRLAPEFPFPTPVEDVYAAAEWMQKQDSVDPARIAVFGASAGGLLAVSCCLMARDRGLSPPIKQQVLLYPMLDDRTTLDDPEKKPLLMLWTEAHNTIGWSAWLGKNRDNVPQYAVPARETNLAGLPKTYIDVGNLDLFQKECEEFAARLADAGVEVESHTYEGLPHGWELLAPTIPATKKAEKNRAAALSSF